MAFWEEFQPVCAAGLPQEVVGYLLDTSTLQNPVLEEQPLPFVNQYLVVKLIQNAFDVFLLELELVVKVDIDFLLLIELGCICIDVLDFGYKVDEFLDAALGFDGLQQVLRHFLNFRKHLDLYICVFNVIVHFL